MNGLALMLAKKINLGDIAVRQGNWKVRYELIGTELRGKTWAFSDSAG